MKKPLTNAHYVPWIIVAKYRTLTLTLTLTRTLTLTLTYYYSDSKWTRNRIWGVKRWHQQRRLKFFWSYEDNDENIDIDLYLEKRYVKCHVRDTSGFEIMIANKLPNPNPNPNPGPNPNHSLLLF